MTATRLRCPRTQNGKEINAAINKIWLESLTKSRSFKYIVTSTSKAVIEVDTEFAGDLIVNLTSLVGDVTVDPAFSSMFSILHTDKQTHSTERTNERIGDLVLKPGKEILAAGYCIYGASTNLVLASKAGVIQYQLDDRDGEFYVSRPVVSLPETTLKLTQDCGNVQHSANFIINFNHVIFKGGLYKSEDLEVSCGAAPLAYIMEKVGGSAVLTPESRKMIVTDPENKVNGKYVKVTDIIPSHLHYNISFLAGTTHEVMNNIL